MAQLQDDVAVGGQLMVGAGSPVMMGVGSAKIRGSAYIEAPAQFGGAKSFSSVEATVMIGKIKNPDSITPPNSLYVKGDTTHEGDYNHTGDMTQKGDYTHEGDVDHVGDSTHIGCFTVSSPPGCNSVFNGNLDIDGYAHATQEITSQTYMSASGNITAGGNVTSNGGAHVLSNKKNLPFDMPHPNKRGWRLRHVCIEGPEIAVYCRGKVPKDGIINLPSFWEGFVNPEDMTINVTPIGHWQELFVKEIRWGKQVVICNNAGSQINANYHIIGRRLDDDLIVEYEGETYQDYPGGNEGYMFSFENDNMERIVKEVVRERLDQMEKNK